MAFSMGGGREAQAGHVDGLALHVFAGEDRLKREARAETKI